MPLPATSRDASEREAPSSMEIDESCSPHVARRVVVCCAARRHAIATAHYWWHRRCWVHFWRLVLARPFRRWRCGGCGWRAVLFLHHCHQLGLQVIIIHGQTEDGSTKIASRVRAAAGRFFAAESRATKTAAARSRRTSRPPREERDKVTRRARTPGRVACFVAWSGQRARLLTLRRSPTRARHESPWRWP
jgi:hypothetical protein